MAAITTKDRFSFALFLALSIHAALILGIGFGTDLNTSENVSITLSLANDLVADEDADFIAATNQQGSGSESELLEMSTTEEADFHNNEFSEVASQATPVQEVIEQSSELLSADATSLEQVSKESAEITELVEAPPTNTLDREKLIQEIASLEARIAQDQQALAKMPRTKSINSASTKSAAEAAYLNAWRQKCERIGQANYPSGQLEGEVLVLVSILADGSLESVRVLKTSGIRALDQAALTTIRQAAPFQPFTVAMRKDYDRLEFTRWWQFTKRGGAFGG